ncbi:phosphoenolpyruvate carboxykinase (GTP) [bacterium]|nr:phosphoenolpyruvate carboxykinase (GTP) [bacterium]
MSTSTDFLRQHMNPAHFDKLMAIDNPKLYDFVAEYVELCEPDNIIVITDAPDDLKMIREKAVADGEEIKLKIAGHTVHFESRFDQARDKENTRLLLGKGKTLGKNINSMDKEEGEKEIRTIMQGIMKGHDVYVRFFCLGPVDSPFSILACQLTDSTYVCHSLDILYRQGYEAFRKAGRSASFFRIVHGQGELENNVSKNVDKRRIYIDVEDEIVYSANTQYGGNTLGLKKLSMRLAIKRATREDWLCEHMFVMGVHGPGERVTYFTGAFPSLCGKTSTSMIPGEKIVGDDIAYLRQIDGRVRAVNVEKGMFGIIMGVNSKDDPIIYKTLHSPNEIIFSNVLMTDDGNVHWIDKDAPVPDKGINYAGEWTPGKKDAKGNEIPPSHKNARFTLSLDCLENYDPRLEDPDGVDVGGVIYGGRDSYAWMPVREAFDWVHGIITIGAALESETTAATLGQEGVPKFNPMSNLDFVSVPLSEYIRSNLDFGTRLQDVPRIFGVNYFLKDETGRWLNERNDKAVWLKWMELRVHGDADAIRTPVGFIPEFEDLQRLFRQVLDKVYTEEDYMQQFSLRIKPFISKINRIIDIYKEVPNAPAVVFDTLNAEVNRLKDVQSELGDLVAPSKFG